MEPLVNEIDELLRGSIDLHIHCGPVAGEYRHDAFELAEQARNAGMRAVVYKDSGYLTAPIAEMINRRMPDFTVVGSITLNDFHGGLNPEAVETAAGLGTKVIWMPTQSAANSIAKFKAMGIPLKGEGISLLDGEGRLRRELGPILELVRDRDMVLATGHISPREALPLVRMAHDMGIRRILLTHPFHSEAVESETFTVDEVMECVKLGAVIEHTFVFHLPTEFSVDPAETADYIRRTGAEHNVISTDLGLFTYNPTPVEGMRMFIATLLRQGFTAAEVEQMAKRNPAALLGL